jgi:hypothetical protein
VVNRDKQITFEQHKQLRARRKRQRPGRFERLGAWMHFTLLEKLPTTKGISRSQGRMPL